MYVSRRWFLRSGLILGSGIALAACSQSTSAPATTAPAPAAPPATSGVAPAPSVGASPAASAIASPSAPPAATAAPAASGSAASVKAAWVATTANQMLWPVAVEAGYFSQYGVNFQLNYLNGSASGVAALLSKDLDTISAGGSAVVAARAQNSDVLMIAGYLNIAIFRIMAMGDISSLDDLKGKTIGVTRIGNVDYFAWQTIMGRQGWAPDDLSFVSADTTNGQVALLQQGQVQAIALSPPNDVFAQEIGAHLLVDTADYNQPEQNTGMVVTRAYLDANRQACLNVNKASVEAVARWRSDPDFCKGVIAKYLKTDDQAFIDEGYSAYAPVWPEAPFASPDAMARVIQEVVAQNPQAQAVAPEQVIDSTVVQELVDTGFIKQIFPDYSGSGA